MSLRRIIHISDLHISEDYGSVLQNSDYKDSWIESLKRIDSIDTLIISGDIVDKGGSAKAYEEAESIVKYVVDELDIKNILCVPGNHDVNRDKLIGIKGDRGIIKEELWKHYDVKLQFYWEFIDNLKLQVNKNSGLVSYAILERPKMVLLGLNSTDQIGIEDEEGSVNVESLEQSLDEIFCSDGIDYKEYIKVAVLHHRPIVYESASEDYSANNGSKVGQYGTCNSSNWRKVKEILLQYNVHVILTGHVHGTQSEQIRKYEEPNDEIYYSTVGSIGVNFNNELKQKLDVAKDEKLLEKLDSLQCYVSLNGNHNAFNILTFDEEGLVKEEQFKFIVDEGKWKWISFQTKNIKKNISEQDNLFDIETEEELQEQREEIDYEEELLRIIRERKLYKTGHFHWKGTARLNWIDVSYLFQRRENILLMVKGIWNLFKQKKELGDVQCIIGLGIKGSILLSYVRFLFPEVKCTYFPENKKEYNKYEGKIFESTEKMCSITLLTDVVHTGKTVKDCIENIRDRISSDLEVNVITIFDTTSDGNISDLEGVASIRMFSLAKIKVLDCSGGGENCKIYTEKLAYVYEYKEDLYESN